VRYPDFISVPLISSGVTVPKNWNMNLFVRESRVNIGSAFSFNTRVFCLRASPSSCTYPGPTIKVRPGDNVTIYFTNELGFDMPLSSSAFPNLPPHGVNTTNLYFHGLRLSPNSSSYFRQVAPGETAELTLSVQPNHAPGVHWYRSQNQGFSALHVLNGLVGAVVVEPETSVTRLNYPTSLKNADLVLMVVTKLVVAQETVGGVVSQSCGPQWSCDPLAQAPLCSGGEDRSPFNPLRLDSLQELTAQAGGRFDVNFQVNASSKGPAPSGSMDLVNGRYQPTVTITQSSPIVFRLIHASGGPPLRLSLTEGALCLMSVIAWDGVYARARTTLSLLTIPAGGRCEVEIKCGDLGESLVLSSSSSFPSPSHSDSVCQE
jgi:FtsP/CotA-like multicopper oxidase with cupredoxin domain